MRAFFLPHHYRFAVGSSPFHR